MKLTSIGILIRASVLLYVILWAIIPEAKTVKQKLEMMGEEDYIRTIREKVSDNMSATRSRSDAEKPADSTADKATVKMTESTSEMPPQPPIPPEIRWKDTPADSPQQSGFLNVLSLFLKIIFFTFVGFLALVLVAIFIGFLFAGAQFMSLKALFIDPGYETNLLIISLSLLVLVPVISIITWIIRRVMKARSRPIIGIISFVLWLAGLTLAGVLAKNVSDKYRVESSKETVVALAPLHPTNCISICNPIPMITPSLK